VKAVEALWGSALANRLDLDCHLDRRRAEAAHALGSEAATDDG
jgi:hypothetical protein